MALRHISRRRAPVDGTIFRTMARLNSIMGAACHHDDKYEWPPFVNDTMVPIFVRMETYKGGETRENPSGMTPGPVVRVGSMDSPEINLFGYHHAAGLFRDYRLDWRNGDSDKWNYNTIEGDTDAPGEDTSVYLCNKCGEHLYRDDAGRRPHYSACMQGGERVCRDCEFTGLVHDQEATEQIERCHKLADHLDANYQGDHPPQWWRRQFDQQIGTLSRGFSFGNPAQTRLYKEDKFSFAWGTTIFTPEGKKRGMNGGLIQHGPCPVLGEDGTFAFRCWDYTLKCEREATAEEVGHISWSIHT